MKKDKIEDMHPDHAAQFAQGPDEDEEIPRHKIADHYARRMQHCLDNNQMELFNCIRTEFYNKHYWGSVDYSESYSSGKKVAISWYEEPSWDKLKDSGLDEKLDKW